MKHSIRCENADPNSPCKCKCGGSLHGLNHRDDIAPWIRSINEHAGGRLGKVITKLSGKRILCTCGKEFIINYFLGYEHDNGFEDKNGKNWWAFVECPYCKYQWSANKLLARITTLSEWL